MGRYKSVVASAPAIRADLVAEIKEKIRKGGYPPDDILDKAFDRMLEEEAGA